MPPVTLVASALFCQQISIFSAERNIGAARGIRTPDPVITNDVLYQLSYCGVTP
jgi:hypothetical protein